MWNIFADISTFTNPNLKIFIILCQNRASLSGKVKQLHHMSIKMFFLERESKEQYFATSIYAHKNISRFYAHFLGLGEFIY